MRDGIAAYDVPARIATYDADMDVMHPLRHEMVAAALALLPFDSTAEFTALDLGAGTGYFTQRLVEAFPAVRVIAIDGAESMIPVARERLGEAAQRVDFRVGDLRGLDELLVAGEQGRVVISSYALHHLDAREKTGVVERCLGFLEPGGWFLNADLIRSESELLEDRYQDARVQGIVRRADPADARFGAPEEVRAFLDAMQEKEGDQPLTLQEDLAVLRAAGLRQVGVSWLEHREAVTSGVR